MIPLVFHDYTTVASNPLTVKTCLKELCLCKFPFPETQLTTTKRYSSDAVHSNPLRLANLLKLLKCGTLSLTALNHMAFALNHDICGEFNYV